MTEPTDDDAATTGEPWVCLLDGTATAEPADRLCNWLQTPQTRLWLLGEEAYLGLLDTDDLLGRHYQPAIVPRPCERCEQTGYDTLDDVTIGDVSYRVCERCLADLDREVTHYYWYDRLTEAHYDRAAAFLRSREEIWCVHDDAYVAGELFVHTPYCSATVVSDVCNHYGFDIYSVRIVDPEESGFDCVAEHGRCVEFDLDYRGNADPLPLEYDLLDDVDHYDIEFLSDADRLPSAGARASNGEDDENERGRHDSEEEAKRSGRPEQT
jgi:hypothetical protein